MLRAASHQSTHKSPQLPHIAIDEWTALFPMRMLHFNSWKIKECGRATTLERKCRVGACSPGGSPCQRLNSRAHASRAPAGHLWLVGAAARRGDATAMPFQPSCFPDMQAAWARTRQMPRTRGSEAPASPRHQHQEARQPGSIQSRGNGDSRHVLKGEAGCNRKECSAAWLSPALLAAETGSRMGAKGDSYADMSWPTRHAQPSLCHSWQCGNAWERQPGLSFHGAVLPSVRAPWRGACSITPPEHQRGHPPWQGSGSAPGTWSGSGSGPGTWSGCGCGRCGPGSGSGSARSGSGSGSGSGRGTGCGCGSETCNVGRCGGRM